MSVVNMNPLALVWKVFMQHAAPNMTKSLSVFSTVRVHTKSDDIFGQSQQLGYNASEMLSSQRHAAVAHSRPSCAKWSTLR